MITKTTSPVLIIDIDKVKRNISMMAGKCKDNGVEFRPHFKTHQSRQIGELFRQSGVHSITVSSLKMANYFADHGWEDITIAFPFNVLEAEQLNVLAGRCSINVLVQSDSVIKLLSENTQNNIGVYLEIDPDYGRSGVPVGNKSRIKELVEKIESYDQLKFVGFYCHAGHTYSCRSAAEVRSLSKSVLKKLEVLAELYPSANICYGDTPSCSLLSSYGPVNQLSPGNFVFYDVMQVEIGSCSIDDIAVMLRVPVVEKKGSSHQLIVHGGAVHLSKEQLSSGDNTHFGVVHEDHNSRLVSISQEHGIIQCSNEFYEKVSIGDEIHVLPVHSCLTADLMREYSDLAGNSYDHLRGAYL